MINRIRTEKEAIKANRLSTYLLEKMLLRKDDIGALESVFPGIVHFNSTVDLSLTACGPKLEALVDLNQEEIIAGGLALMETVIHEDSIRQIPPLLMNYLQQNDASKEISFCQKIRERQHSNNFRWLFTSSKVIQSSPNTMLSVSFYADDFIRAGNQVNRLLDDHQFIRKNLDRFAILTKREKDILSALAVGKTAPQIAEEKFIAINTVKTHRQRIFEKLGVKTYLELYQFALHFDLL